MIEHLFVCGYPSDVGGANTELWHTVKLWRRFGLGVTLIPTWQADPAWQARLEAIGCRTLPVQPADAGPAGGTSGQPPAALEDVAGLPGSVVVSLCNTKFLGAAARFRRLGCRIVWLGCMNWLFPAERLHYRQYGLFHRHVFQSRFQQDQLVPQLRRFGYQPQRGRIIRGPLDVAEFPFRPAAHAAGEVFPIGRMSRAAADKFSPHTWQIYGRVPHPISARLLGWDREVRDRLGPPPSWATCLPPASQSSREFLAGLAALVHAGGEADENWPRVGLEAMAAGVPLVVDNRGGWREMIRHGQTGYLCQNSEQFAYYTARLAYDEPHRLQIARQARAALEHELADPRTLWTQWQQLLEEIVNDP
jgi:glycosyltransferase involved in cell wall biosynthesis